MKKVSLIAGLALAVLFILPAAPTFAQEELPGAFYFGDSGTGNGIIGPEDSIAVRAVILGGFPSYAGCVPQVEDIQELDGDLVVGPGDGSKITSWILNSYADPLGVGKPFRLELLTPSVDIVPGDSATLAVRVWDNPANGNLAETLRPGWGVIFEVLPSSDCPTALIEGRDVTPIGGGGKGQFILASSAYEYTDSFVSGGEARVKLWAPGCLMNGEIQVRVHIPSDGEAGVSGGRFPVPLYASQDIVATIHPPFYTVTDIAIDQPDPTSITELASQTFTATCTYSDLTTDDCSRAGGVLWSFTGDLSDDGGGQATALHIPCGDGGAVAVTAQPIDDLVLGDTHGIVVVNDETVVSALISPPGATIPELGTQQFAIDRTWSDTCVDHPATTWGKGTDTCATMPSTINASGLFTAGRQAGGAGCAAEVTATGVTNSPQTVTVTNTATVTSDLMAPVAPISIPELGTQQFIATRTWSDGFTEPTPGVVWGKANDTCATVASTVSAAGLLTAGRQGCGGGCTVQVTATKVNNSPQTVTVTNTATILSDLISPSSPVYLDEGQCVQFIVTRTWSDGCTEPTPGVVWGKGPDTCGTPSTVNPTGYFCAGQMPCGTGCTVTLSASPANNSPVTIIINNNDTLVSFLISPAPASLYENHTLQFALHRMWSDGCDENLTTSAGWFLSGGNCANSAIGSSSGTFTAGSYPGSTEPACVGQISSTAYNPSNEPVTVTVHDDSCAGMAPVIASVFPLDFADRFRGNAHTNQHLTIVVDNAYGCLPTSVTASCGAVTFNCNYSGLPDDPDVVCTPSTTLTQNTTYNCTVTVTNPGGSDVAVGSMTTGLSAAAPSGGLARGYIGGLDYDSATASVGPGTVTVKAIDAVNSTYIPGKVYAQVIQGGTVREYFLDPATGARTITLDPLPITELTLGYKCGGEACPKRESSTLAQYRAGNYRDYQYQTLYNVDASEIILPLSLLSSADVNRYRARVMGTLLEADFAKYIAAQPSIRWRSILGIAPVKFRVGLVFFTQKGEDALGPGLDDLLLSPDTMTSISLCITNTSMITYKLPAALPPNLVAPDVRRTNWATPCASWAANPGVYKWFNYAYTPGEFKTAWSLGVYINGSYYIDKGIDMVTYPFYLCALGARGATIPAGLSTGDTIVHMGTQLSWIYDLREDWDNDGLGFDPDTTVNRKVVFAMTGKLPIDPARRDATVYLGGIYKVPNLTDSSLWTDATWDDRFYRPQAIMTLGGDFGASTGLGITGLSTTPRLDDPQFTLFQITYTQSTTPRMGKRDVAPWAGGGNTEAVSAQSAGVSSTWTDPPGTVIDFTARESGGPTNYKAIVALTRGYLVETALSDPNLSLIGAIGPVTRSPYHPGTIISVWHVGPAEAAGNEVIAVPDFLNMPQAVAPNPDKYLYPAPMWSNTLWASLPLNRNGELWRIRTVSAADAIPSDAADIWDRRYFEFTRPTVMNAATRAVHSWALALTESDLRTDVRQFREKRSIKSKVSDIDGRTNAAGGHTFSSFRARFISQGVRAGDVLWINSAKYAPYGQLNHRTNITAVTSETDLAVTDTWGSPGSLPAGATNVRYKVLRKTAARGECLIDEWAGGSPNGYLCLPNTFWRAQGPVVGTGNVRVHLPAVTVGPRILNGVTGVVPSFWDGVVAGSQLQWDWSVKVYNTGAYSIGGLGGPFTWNNQSFYDRDSAIQFLSRDGAMCLYQ